MSQVKCDLYNETISRRNLATSRTCIDKDLYRQDKQLYHPPRISSWGHDLAVSPYLRRHLRLQGFDNGLRPIVVKQDQSMQYFIRPYVIYSTQQHIWFLLSMKGPFKSPHCSSGIAVATILINSEVNNELPAINTSLTESLSPCAP
jgi:hypothetical protein